MGLGGREGAENAQTVAIRPKARDCVSRWDAVGLVGRLGEHDWLINANNGNLLREFRLPDRKRWFKNAVFTPDGKKLIADDDGGRTFSHSEYGPGGVVVWDVATGQIEKKFKVPTGASGLTISANGKLVAAEAIGYPIWELSSGTQINPLSDTDLAISGSGPSPTQASS